jgi:hypothetical protein
METVIVVPSLSVRAKLYVEMLFAAEGALQVMVMVVAVEVMPTEVGGSGLGGGAQDSPSEVDPNLHVH